VGAGLLANAVYQSTCPSLTHRIREQARSHIFDSRLIWEMASDAEGLHGRIKLPAEH
jgi:hypothetical protein